MGATPVQLSLSPPRREWPDGHLDAEALARLNWQPVPIRQFLFKVFTRCNLHCDYCYVYELADQSWRTKPTIMSAQVVEAAARRIGEHAAAHDLDEVRVIFHGGEPLLAGADFLRSTVGTVRDHLPACVRAGFGMQSNGTLLTDDMIDVCADAGISIGISLDGDRAANDRHRLHRDGASSYDEVLGAIRRLQERNPRLFTGLLCTIDLTNDPVETFEALAALGVPSVDFLLPHGNWTTYPPGHEPNSTHHADWLIAIFDRWFGAPSRVISIRFFEEILNLVLGGRSQVETIGVTPATLVVVETNGDIEQVDSLKSAFDGAAGTGLSVLTSSFDDALRRPGFAARQIGHDALSDGCRSCAVVDVCGGGYYPHRYREGSGFRNPSVYCRDLELLIRHIHGQVVEQARTGRHDV